MSQYHPNLSPLKRLSFLINHLLLLQALLGLLLHLILPLLILMVLLEKVIPLLENLRFLIPQQWGELLHHLCHQSHQFELNHLKLGSTHLLTVILTSMEFWYLQLWFMRLASLHGFGPMITISFHLLALEEVHFHMDKLEDLVLLLLQERMVISSFPCWFQHLVKGLIDMEF